MIKIYVQKSENSLFCSHIYPADVFSLGLSDIVFKLELGEKHGKIRKLHQKILYFQYVLKLPLICISVLPWQWLAMGGSSAL